MDESETADDDVASVEAQFGDASSCSSLSVQDVADLEECEDTEEECDEQCEDDVSSHLPTVIDYVEAGGSVTAASCAVPVSVQDSRSGGEQSADAGNSCVCQSVKPQRDENVTEAVSLRRERTALWCTAVTSLTAADSREPVTVNHCHDQRLSSVSEEDRVSCDVTLTDTDSCHTALSHVTANANHLPAASCADRLVANSSSSEPCQSSDSCGVNLPLVEDGLSSGHVSEADDDAAASGLPAETSSTQHCELMCDTAALCDDDVDDDDDHDNDRAERCCSGQHQEPVWIARYSLSLCSSTDHCYIFIHNDLDAEFADQSCHLKTVVLNSAATVKICGDMQLETLYMVGQLVPCPGWVR